MLTGILNKGEDMSNIHAAIHAKRGGAGAGAHKSKAQRGSGKRGKGKSQRHPKHKEKQCYHPS